MSAITIDGDLVHYEVLGRGRPVILLHGWLGSWRYWIPLMQQLHLKYRVYAIDLFGFGDSGKNPKKYTIDEQMKLLDAFMQELGIPKAAFVGHGFGAMVIISYATKYPDRVARALMANLPLFDPGGLPDRNPAGFQVPLKPIDPKTLLDQEVSENRAIAPTTEATLANPNLIDRDRLKQAAEQAQSTAPATVPTRPKETPPPTTTPPAAPSASSSNSNPLKTLFAQNDLQALLAKCFKKSDSSYEKLLRDVEKTDAQILPKSAEKYIPVEHLDSIRLLKMPIALVHGSDDPIMTPPTDDVWDYLTLGREDSLIAIPLEGIKHFPMLEHDPFPRFVMDFMEAPDVKQIAIRERWQRRSR